MSDTPRTDAKTQFFGWNPEDGEEFVRANFARELERENLALREDKERLDWLDRVNENTNERNGTNYGWRYDINHNRAALTDCNLPALSIRAAIDAARKEKPCIVDPLTFRDASKKVFTERADLLSRPADKIINKEAQP